MSKTKINHDKEVPHLGCREKYKRFMDDEIFRVSPLYRNCHLTHGPDWYLQDEHILRRPSMGLLSLGRFALWLLYRTQVEANGSKAHVQASRLMLRIRKRMAYYMYQGGKTKRLTRELVKRYAGACRKILPLARRAYELYRAEQKAQAELKKILPIPLDAIHEDMV